MARYALAFMLVLIALTPLAGADATITTPRNTQTVIAYNHLPAGTRIDVINESTYAMTLPAGNVSLSSAPPVATTFRGYCPSMVNGTVNSTTYAIARTYWADDGRTRVLAFEEYTNGTLAATSHLNLTKAMLGVFTYEFNPFMPACIIDYFVGTGTASVYLVMQEYHVKEGSNGALAQYYGIAEPVVGVFSVTFNETNAEPIDQIVVYRFYNSVALPSSDKPYILFAGWNSSTIRVNVTRAGSMSVNAVVVERHSSLPPRVIAFQAGGLPYAAVLEANDTEIEASVDSISTLSQSLKVNIVLVNITNAAYSRVISLSIPVDWQTVKDFADEMLSKAGAALAAAGGSANFNPDTVTIFLHPSLDDIVYNGSSILFLIKYFIAVGYYDPGATLSIDKGNFYMTQYGGLDVSGMVIMGMTADYAIVSIDSNSLAVRGAWYNIIPSDLMLDGGVGLVFTSKAITGINPVKASNAALIYYSDPIILSIARMNASGTLSSLNGDKAIIVAKQNAPLASLGSVAPMSFLSFIDPPVTAFYMIAYTGSGAYEIPLGTLSLPAVGLREKDVFLSFSSLAYNSTAYGAPLYKMTYDTQVAGALAESLLAGAGVSDAGGLATYASDYARTQPLVSYVAPPNETALPGLGVSSTITAYDATVMGNYNAVIVSWSKGQGVILGGLLLSKILSSTTPSATTWRSLAYQEEPVSFTVYQYDLRLTPYTSDSSMYVMQGRPAESGIDPLSTPETRVTATVTIMNEDVTTTSSTRMYLVGSYPVYWDALMRLDGITIIGNKAYLRIYIYYVNKYADLLKNYMDGEKAVEINAYLLDRTLVDTVFAYSYMLSQAGIAIVIPSNTAVYGTILQDNKLEILLSNKTSITIYAANPKLLKSVYVDGNPVCTGSECTSMFKNHRVTIDPTNVTIEYEVLGGVARGKKVFGLAGILYAVAVASVFSLVLARRRLRLG